MTMSPLVDIAAPFQHKRPNFPTSVFETRLKQRIAVKKSREFRSLDVKTNFYGVSS